MSNVARGSLPPKLYYRIGEVAELVGVEPHVLRYWEREFRSIRPTKSAKGQRVYSRRDVENLMRVRELLYSEGFTIAGAKKKLQRSGTGADSDPDGEREAAPELQSAREPSPEPETGPSGLQLGLAPKTRDQLVAMRGDIEAFLEELARSHS